VRNVLLLLALEVALIPACTNDYGQFRFPMERSAGGSADEEVTGGSGAAGAPSTGGSPNPGVTGGSPGVTGGSPGVTGGSPGVTGGGPGVTGGSAGAN